jgi:hypothetical protein
MTNNREVDISLGPILYINDHANEEGYDWIYDNVPFYATITSELEDWPGYGVQTKQIEIKFRDQCITQKSCTSNYRHFDNYCAEEKVSVFPGVHYNNCAESEYYG